jgi:O-acetyl-ADP-ribose deacetylase (regulator of RNase III)
VRYIVINPDPKIAWLIADSLRKVLPARRAEDKADDRIGSVNNTLEKAVTEGLKADALITPGNSYGDMSGGFDLAVRDLLGMDIQHKVQSFIQNTYYGEIPVGSAFVIKLPKGAPFGHLVYTPTMRIPKRLPVNSDAVYLSILSAMQAIGAWNRSQILEQINSVVLTAHGHATGGAPLPTIARQTAMAVSQFERRWPIGTQDTVERDRNIHLWG